MILTHIVLLQTTSAATTIQDIVAMEGFQHNSNVRLVAVKISDSRIVIIDDDCPGILSFEKAHWITVDQVEDSGDC